MNHVMLSLCAALAVSLSVAESSEKKPEVREATPNYPALTVPVSSLGAAVSDGWIYVYGGHSGKTHTYSTEGVSKKFHRTSVKGGEKWEELPGGPGIQGLALVAHKGKLYRIGGMEPRNKPDEPADNHSLKSFACFDPATKKWEAMPDLPAPRSSHDAVVLGDRIYVVGGWQLAGSGQKGEWHTTSLVMDLSKKPLKWESIEQPFQRRALTAAAFQGKVYVLAGLGSNAGPELVVNVYDPTKKEWSKGPEIPGPQRNGFTPASCVAGDRLLLSTSDGIVWRMKTTGDGWEEVARLQHSRVVHRLLPVRDTFLVAVGGATREKNVGEVEVLIPGAANPNPNKKPSTSKAGEQTYCPIMRTVSVGNDSKVVEYRGVKVLLCCETCARKWKADPGAYLDKMTLPQLASMELPKRKLEQVYCPVYQDRVVSEKDPFVMYRGKKVYLFNQVAVKRWEENPKKFASVEFLPQLRGTTQR
jgi:hypothetical protein